MMFVAGRFNNYVVEKILDSGDGVKVAVLRCVDFFADDIFDCGLTCSAENQQLFVSETTVKNMYRLHASECSGF